MKVILIIIVALLVLVIVIGLIRTKKTQTSKNQSLFQDGHVPNPVPNGFYKGTITGYSGSWQGKKFNPTIGSGINIFKESDQEIEKYPFKTYIAKGVQEKNLDVYRIDYSLPENPFWVRFITDEIVELEPGKYLGKIHLRLIPGLPFSLGYFRLEK